MEESFLYQACRFGVFPPQTLLTPEGREEWRPLEDVLPYYFSYRGEAQGPLTLKQIQAFAAQTPNPVLVTEPGGSEWQPLSSFTGIAPLPPPLPVVASTAPLVQAPLARRPGRTRSPFPGGVTAAGSIWILYGGLRLLTVAFLLLSVLTLEPVVIAVGLIAAGLPFFIGIAFLTIGVKTVRGTVASLRANGFGSIGIAVVATVMQYMILSPATETIFFVDVCLNFLLFIAGVMAVSENSRFLAWKAAQKTDAPSPLCGC